MPRKYAIVLLMMLAYSIVLAHSVIPHHHHDPDHELAQGGSHHDHHDDDSDEEQSDFAHSFESYIHATNDGDIHEQPKNDFFNTLPTLIVTLPFFDHFFSPTEDPPKLAFQQTDDPLPSLYLLSSRGLRAPPTL